MTGSLFHFIENVPDARLRHIFHGMAEMGHGRNMGKCGFRPQKGNPVRTLKLAGCGHDLGKQVAENLFVERSLIQGKKPLENLALALAVQNLPTGSGLDSYNFV